MSQKVKANNNHIDVALSLCIVAFCLQFKTINNLCRDVLVIHGIWRGKAYLVKKWLDGWNSSQCCQISYTSKFFFLENVPNRSQNILSTPVISLDMKMNLMVEADLAHQYSENTIYSCDDAQQKSRFILICRYIFYIHTQPYHAISKIYKTTTTIKENATMRTIKATMNAFMNVCAMFIRSRYTQ